MKNALLTKISLGCLLISLLIAAGCHIHIGSCDNGGNAYKYERTVQLSAPMAAGGIFAARTHNGSLTITGTDTTECSVTATIKARAGSEEDAKKLAEEIEISLDPSGDKLTAKIHKPASLTNRPFKIDFNVTIPKDTSLELTTHNGPVKITNINGQINATTHNGRLTAEQTSGTIKLHTHNGRVTCKQISGDIQLKSHNGGLKAVYSKTAPPVCNVSMVTHNGGINFTAPLNFSAEAEINTHNGSIHTDLPITVIGKVNKRKLTGTIGAGEGKLHLRTHNGSITIK